MVFYLDDGLIIHQSPVMLEHHTDQVCKLLNQLGWILSVEKLRLNPSQDFVYLGGRFSTKLDKVSPTAQRVLGIQSLIEPFLKQNKVSARSFLEILGHMASLIDLVPLVRLHMRGLQFCLLKQWKTKWDIILKMIWVIGSPKTDLMWRKETPLLAQWGGGGQLWSPTGEICFKTDASKTGWGAHWENQMV